MSRMALRACCGYTCGKAVLQATAPSVRCVLLRDFGSLTFDVPPLETSRWRAVSRVLRSTVDSVSCTFLPVCCSLCGSPLPRFSSVPICSSCWVEVRSELPPACARCGDSLDIPAATAELHEEAVCRVCRLAPPPFVRAVAFGLYEGRMRDVIHSYKYGRLHPAAQTLGALLATAITQLAEDAPNEMLVVPVPLHRSKHTERGFNQARSLAEQALLHLRRSHPAWRLMLAPTALLRQRATKSQAGLDTRARRINMRGVFAVSDRAALAGRHILLVDDILTTGATARSAARSLLRAGAESVWVATLARARRMHGLDESIFEMKEGLTRVR